MGEFTHPNARSEYVATGPGWKRQLIHEVSVNEVGTTQLQIGDITWLMYVPAGAVIVDGFLANDDLETSTLLTVNIGDSTTTNLFFSATTTPQSATSSSILAASRYTKFASATRLKMTVATSAGTPVAGTLIFGLSYFVDPELTTTTGVAPVTITA
jgi:hypothetical protein